ncbi:MAG: hypothetical protein WAT12_00600 [Candidatus Nitrotoga sp.]
MRGATAYKQCSGLIETYTSGHDADREYHETQGVDAQTGKMWVKDKNWFVYCVHFVAITHYEIPLAFEVIPASHGESPHCDD